MELAFKVFGGLVAIIGSLALYIFKNHLIEIKTALEQIQETQIEQGKQIAKLEAITEERRAG